MPIKPIDMQVLLPNVKRAARPENVKQAAKEMSAQQQQIHEEKEIKQKGSKVQHTENKDQNSIKNDQKDRNSSQYHKKKKKKDEEEEEKKPVIPNHGTRFDIKV